MSAITPGKTAEWLERLTLEQLASIYQTTWCRHPKQVLRRFFSTICSSWWFHGRLRASHLWCVNIQQVFSLISKIWIVNSCHQHRFQPPNVAKQIRISSFNCLARETPAYFQFSSILWFLCMVVLTDNSHFHCVNWIWICTITKTIFYVPLIFEASHKKITKCNIGLGRKGCDWFQLFVGYPFGPKRTKFAFSWESHPSGPLYVSNFPATTGSTKVDYIDYKIVAPSFACVHWHQNMTRSSAALIWHPWWKSFVYSPMDQSEHKTLALLF